MKPTVDLDHVAIATTDISAALQTAVGELGGIVFHGGDGYGFRWIQTRVGSAVTGTTIELLVVWQPEINDFLDRFLARHGPGVHHMTFKVRDLEATLDRCAALGLEPVGVNLENPQWREAFLQPKQAHGTVVQLAQTSDEWDFAELIADAERTGTTMGTPIWWPDPPARTTTPATIDRVVLGSPDRTEATAFFAELLDGEISHRGSEHTELHWPGGGRIRLVDAPQSGFVRLEATADVAAETTVDLSGASVLLSPTSG